MFLALVCFAICQTVKLARTLIPAFIVMMDIQFMELVASFALQTACIVHMLWPVIYASQAIILSAIQYANRVLHLVILAMTKQATVRPAILIFSYQIMNASNARLWFLFAFHVFSLMEKWAATTVLQPCMFHKIHVNTVMLVAQLAIH